MPVTSLSYAAEQGARIELAARGIDPDTAEDTTTVEEFLADQRAGLAEDDRHREITDEHELAGVVAQRDAELRAIEPQPAEDAAETNVPDIRDVAASERKRRARPADDWTRVPAADETADSVTPLSAHSPNSNNAAVSSNDVPTMKHERASSRTGISATVPLTEPSSMRTARGWMGSDVDSAGRRVRDIGGRPDPCHVHFRVAATPRPRSRSNGRAVTAARYSWSIVSGIAVWCRRVRGAAGISAGAATLDHTGWSASRRQVHSTPIRCSLSGPGG
jgi:hypothetical protein